MGKCQFLLCNILDLFCYILDSPSPARLTGEAALEPKKEVTLKQCSSSVYRLCSNSRARVVDRFGFRAERVGKDAESAGKSLL